MPLPPNATPEQQMQAINGQITALNNNFQYIATTLAQLVALAQSLQSAAATPSSGS